MPADRPGIEECKSLGKQRMQELRELQTHHPDDFFSRLEALSWISIKEVIDHPFTKPETFHLVLLELFELLQEVVINQRGPAFLGYFRHIELNFSLRVQASYDPEQRVVRLNLGSLLFVNELGATYQWLYSLLTEQNFPITSDDITRLVVPAPVINEFTALYHAGEDGLPVSGQHGLNHPIGLTILRFVLAHEFGHLIYFAESQTVRTFWENNAESDFQDVIEHLVQSHQLSVRGTMPDEEIMARWTKEFVADGVAFYTLLKWPAIGHIECRLAYPLLQMAIEVFFLTLATVYHGDVGTDTHPPPTIRSYTIRAGQRKLCHLGWGEFFAQDWNIGWFVSELLVKIVKTIKNKEESHEPYRGND